MFRRFTFAAFLLAAFASVPSFTEVACEATVIQGDSIVVAGKCVRLRGIDAPGCGASTPPSGTTCTAYGQEWAFRRTTCRRNQWPRRRRGHLARPLRSAVGVARSALLPCDCSRRMAWR